MGPKWLEIVVYFSNELQLVCVIIHIFYILGAKLHACELCDKRYASSFSLKSHKLNTHGVGK